MLQVEQARQTIRQGLQYARERDSYHKCSKGDPSPQRHHQRGTDQSIMAYSTCTLWNQVVRED